MQNKTHLVKHVPCVWYDNHLELALHLPNHKFAVKAIGTCKYQQTRSARGKERRR